MSETAETEKVNINKEIENLPHEDLLEVTYSSLRRIIAADSLLSDLPGDVTVEEVVSQIAVVYGQSITVTILRGTESPLSVVIPQMGTTVLDLKKAIRRAFDLKQQRMKSKTKISWRYIWRTYHLRYDSQTMRDDKKLVTDYGVRNKSEITFVKRIKKEDMHYRIRSRHREKSPPT